jgi:hypothetical protein
MKSSHGGGGSTNNPRTPKIRSNRFSRDELIFQPWFLPKHSHLAINSMIPPGYRNKMRNYFDDYGCMICGEMDLVYASNGMCVGCHGTIRKRILRCVGRRVSRKPDNRVDLFMIRRAKLAKKILGKFSPKWRARSLRQRADIPMRNNPIDDVLGFLSPVIAGIHARIPNPAPSDNGPSSGKSVRDLRQTRPHR